jgi:hypothetical protein
VVQPDALLDCLAAACQHCSVWFSHRERERDSRKHVSGRERERESRKHVSGFSPLEHRVSQHGWDKLEGFPRWLMSKAPSLISKRTLAFSCSACYASPINKLFCLKSNHKNNIWIFYKYVFIYVHPRVIHVT